MHERPPSATPRGALHDRLDAVQAALGLTLSNLAAALHISTQRLADDNDLGREAKIVDAGQFG